MQQGQDQNPGDASRTFINVLAFVLRSIATTANVFLHRGFGKRYFGLQAAAPLLIVPMFGTLFPRHDQRLLLTFLAAYLVMCLLTRVGSMLRRRVEGVHTHYDGYPRLMFIFRRWQEFTVKRFIEPLVMLGISVLVLRFDEPLGAYFLCTSLVMFATRNAGDAFERAKALDLSDSLFEQRQVGYRIRSIHGNRF